MAEVKLLSGPGGYPELGDTVYNEDGSEAGTLEFFYASQGVNRWGVKVGTDADDHTVHVVERVGVQDEAERTVGCKLVLHPGERFIDAHESTSDLIKIDNGGESGTAPTVVTSSEG